MRRTVFVLCCSLAAASLPVVARAQTRAPNPTSVAGRHAAPDAAAPPASRAQLPQSWTAAQPYPTTIVRYAFADAGETFYVLGGVSEGVRQTAARRYSTATDTWTTLAPIPSASEAPAAALLNNKIYLAEGDTGTHFYIYDITANSWSTSTNVPGLTDRYGAAAGAFGTKVYVVGGSTSGPSTDVRVFDVTSGLWSLGNAAPSGYRLGGYTTVGQYLYCVGTLTADANANSTAMMRLDMAAGTWTTGPAFTPRRADFALAAIGDTLFAIGGDTNGTGFFDSTNLVDEYRLSSYPGGTWKASPNTLFVARQGNQAGFNSHGRAGGEIWSTGGLTGSTFTFLADHVYRAQAPTDFDFDEDGFADVGVFRPSTSTWYVQRSQLGFTGVPFGTAGDRAAPADFDGDGRTDVAVFRPSTGFWYWTNSSNGSFGQVQFGTNGDQPVPADYDGDGKADVCVFRPSTGVWYRLNSTDGAAVTVPFGLAGDRPTPADFDGDRKADIAVFRPSSATWFRRNSSDGRFVAMPFGLGTDLAVPADFEGDGRADIAVFRASSGTWYRLDSHSNAFVAVAFGTAGDLPVRADYDGDGIADVSVFRPSTNVWYRINSGNASIASVFFGAGGDVPLPYAFVY